MPISRADELAALRRSSLVAQKSFRLNAASSQHGFTTPEGEAGKLKRKSMMERKSRLDARANMVSGGKSAGMADLNLLYKKLMKEQRERQKEAQRNLHEWRKKHVAKRRASGEKFEEVEEEEPPMPEVEEASNEEALEMLPDHVVAALKEKYDTEDAASALSKALQEETQDDGKGSLATLMEVGSPKAQEGQEEGEEEEQNAGQTQLVEEKDPDEKHQPAEEESEEEEKEPAQDHQSAQPEPVQEEEPKENEEEEKEDLPDVGEEGKEPADHEQEEPKEKEEEEKEDPSDMGEEEEEPAEEDKEPKSEKEEEKEDLADMGGEKEPGKEPQPAEPELVEEDEPKEMEADMGEEEKEPAEEPQPEEPDPLPVEKEQEEEPLPTLEEPQARETTQPEVEGEPDAPNPLGPKVEEEPKVEEGPKVDVPPKPRRELQPIDPVEATQRFYNTHHQEYVDKISSHPTLTPIAHRNAFVTQVQLQRSLGPSDPVTIVDLGCGSGRDAAHFASSGHHVLGVDFSAEMLGRAKEAAPAAHYLNMDVRSLPGVLVDRSVDGIWAHASLCHLAKGDALELLKGLHGAAKAGGVLFLSLKMADDERRDEELDEGGRDGVLDVDERYSPTEEDVAGDGSDDSRRKLYSYYTPEEARDMLAAAGWDVTEEGEEDKRGEAYGGYASHRTVYAFAVRSV